MTKRTTVTTSKYVFDPPRVLVEGVRVEVIPPAFTWASQATQYSAYGAPGLNYEQHAVNAKGKEVALGDPGAITIIDCLLMRDYRGHLIGILNHYTVNGENQLEKTGNVNIWVTPRCQRRGIATMLWREARQRWDVDWQQQRYTVSGLKWLKGLLEGGAL